MTNEKSAGDGGGKGLSASFVTGVIALVFLVTGYQTALFINRAAVSKIIADTPDTVYIYVHEDAASGRRPGTAPPDMSPSSGRAASGRVRMERGGRTTEQRETVGTVKDRFSERRYESFPFDPNTASVEELQRLGFSRKQAQSIENYRSKGGRFRRPEDFAKSYVVADSVYERLKNYISIPKLDINAADSAAFETLPGIGGYFAAKMVSYRKSLGGYSYPEQLMDIYNFDEEKFDGLRDLIEVGDSEPYALWTLPEDSLRLHPYIGRYAARGVVLYRENHPESAWTVDGLAEAGVLKPSDASKLSRCRIAAP